jgi:MbtH protein
MSDGEAAGRFTVLVNDEEQYSIWEAERPHPKGWRDVGKSGTKDECLEYIERVWTDMRPLSVRRGLERSSAER